MKKTIKELFMLSCAGILVGMFFLTELQAGVEKNFGKYLPVNQPLVQALFPSLASKNSGEEKKHSIDWAKKYPFPEGVEKGNKTVNQLNAFLQGDKKDKFIQKATHHMENHIVGFQWLVERGKLIEQMAGWNVFNPAMQVMQLEDGTLTYVYPRRPEDMNDDIKSVQELAETAQRHHARFVYVVAPFKVDKYGDDAIRDHFDFSNDNADRFLEKLRLAGVDTIDLREVFADESTEEYHKLFYRTDHHWRPQGAVRAAQYLAKRFKEDFGIETDTEHLSAEDYVWHTEKEAYLGSQGRKVTLALTQPDDFDWIEPKFPTRFHAEFPSSGVDSVGDFSILMDDQKIDKNNLYHTSPYHNYFYGDCDFARVENLSHANFTDQKILAITDSFGDAMLPFLSVGIKQLVKIDVRAYKGSVAALIEAEEPDVVFVMYNAGMCKGEKINWATHADLFDFR